MSEQAAKEGIRAGIQIVAAVANAIRELKQVPSGHLYAQVMSQLSLEDFNKVIAILKKAEIVKEENNLLIWLEE